MRATAKVISLTLILCLTGMVARAESIQCSDLFPNFYTVNEFVLSIAGKKQSETFLLQAHKNLTNNFDIKNMRQILKVIRKFGLEGLHPDQRNFIIKFRQNTSFLRSIFQTNEVDHKSPKDYANFVKDFGVLKDYLLMEDSEKAQLISGKILKKYAELDFDDLLISASPASKKSVQKYFKTILTETQEIMARPTVTVDQVHQVRKNLRDVLRYLQIQNEVQFAKTAGSKILILNPTVDVQDNLQIEFLKKINSKLGEICDANSAQVLNGELDADKVVEFPIKVRPRVEYFLEHYRIVVKD